MTKERSGADKEKSKIVSIYRHRKPKRRHYSRRWKSLCREILCEFQKHLSETTGGPIKWDRIRRLIMKSHDKYDGNVLVEEDTRLRRQDLEYWIKHDSDMDDAKFAFIDLFLRKELIHNKTGIEGVIDKIVEYRDWENMKALTTVFQGMFFQDSTAAIALLWPSILQKFFEFEGSGSNSYTYLYVGDIQDDCEMVARAVLFISDAPYANAKSLIARSKKYFGYVVPIAFSNETNAQEPLSKLLLFDRSSVDGLRVNTFSDSFLCEQSSKLKCIATIPADELGTKVSNDPRNERDREHADALRSGDKGKYLNLLEKARSGPWLNSIEINNHDTDQLECLRDEYLIW